MKREDLILVWFNYHGFSFSGVESIFEKFDTVDELFDKSKVSQVLGKDANKKFLDEYLKTDFEKFESEVEEDLYKFDIKFVTYLSDDYPKNLLDISEPPIVLYYKGDLEILNENTISIVGTRKPTTYGKIVCENFTKELVESGLVTISGLAYGIDTIVAETTLANSGKTVAVLAGGLDSIYPSQNNALSKRIVENGGLLITEYRPRLRPQGYYFVNRNRIVSALGLGLLIVEAGKSSGTMTTAKYALDQSKELFVVPGNINSPQSEGTNSLIDQMPDIFTISASRILFKLNIKKKEVQKSAVQVDMLEANILAELENGEMTFDDIAEKLKISPSVLSSKLIKMEMFGLVKKGNGNTYYKM